MTEGRIQAEVRIILGTERSQRSAKIDALMAENWRRAFLLVPTRQHAARRTERIILSARLDGAFGKYVHTLDDFATALMRAEGVDPVRLRDAERRLLLSNCIEGLRRDGRLEMLGSAAETNGFRSHVLRVITQLKQAAIEPADFRERVARRRLRSPLDDVVADVYSAYQDALLGVGMYDLPGLFWKADSLCSYGTPKLVTNVALLALDGFDDFTPSEFRLLTSIAAHVPRLVFGINYDDSGNRADLYKTTANTLKQIRERFHATVENMEEPPPRTFLEYASTNIFWRDEPQLPHGLEPNISVVPCVDFTQEVETIGRRVKSLLLDHGVPIDEIAVVYRNLRDAAAPLRSVFAEFGVPMRLIQQPTLWQSAVFAFLSDVLEATDGWTRQSVVNVLSSRWLNPAFARGNSAWNAKRDAFSLLSRAAQIISGVDEWRDRLCRFAQHGDKDLLQRLEQNLGNVNDAAEALMQGIDFLQDLQKRIPEKAAIRDFAAALDELIRNLGVAEAVESHPLDETRAHEREALSALRGILGAWRSWHVAASDVQPRSEFLSLLRQAAQETSFAVPGLNDGVACLDAESARLLRFDYVFFGGVNEGDVPCASASSAIYTEEDLKSLAEQGILIQGRRAHAEREALLFHHVLNVPRKRLCITWRMLSRQGNEQYPSPYVTDIISLFHEEPIQEPCPRAHHFVPEPNAIASWRDFRNAVCQAGAHRQDFFASQFSQLATGIDIERQRRDRSPFGAYDGVLGSSEFLASEYGAEHVYSVQQIETYKACPFRFLVERIFGVEPVEIPVAEFDALVRGSILHNVLQAFHEQYRGRAVADIDTAEAIESMRMHVDDVFAKKAWRSTTTPRGVESVEKMRMLAVLERYLLIERERGENEWKPSHFEIGFGRTPGAESDPLTHPDPFPLNTPAGPVLFAGRIDRIDLSNGEARIIDYKSGRLPAPGDLSSGTSLQLALYALALDELLMPGSACRDAWFLQIGREKRQEALHGSKRADDQWPVRQELVRNVVAQCIEAIRAGRFPPTPLEKACDYCAAANVCRYESGRIARKEAAS